MLITPLVTEFAVIELVVSELPISEVAVSEVVVSELVVSELVVTELAKRACVEMNGGTTLFVANEATVDVSCSVFTEFPPVILDMDKYFVKTFCVES